LSNSIIPIATIRLPADGSSDEIYKLFVFIAVEMVLHAKIENAIRKIIEEMYRSVNKCDLEGLNFLHFNPIITW
jgi:hypothetical protein